MKKQLRTSSPFVKHMILSASLIGMGSAGRVFGRKHWVSDTVAGGIVGYAMGSWLWHAQRDQSKSGLSINPGPKEISVTWQGKY